MRGNGIRPATEDRSPKLDEQTGLVLDPTLGQYMTDPRVARALVRWARIGAEDHVLEPGAGSGRIVDACLEAGARVTAWELDARFVRYLEARHARDPRVGIWSGDIRRVGATPCNVAAMNPPFEDDQEGELLLHCARLAGRACAIIRLHGLAGVERLEHHWTWLQLHRVGVLVPRPPFHGSGTHDIAFVQATPRNQRRRAQEIDRVRFGWVRWR